jgi:hypothetical protein
MKLYIGDRFRNYSWINTYLSKNNLGIYHVIYNARFMYCENVSEIL